MNHVVKQAIEDAFDDHDYEMELQLVPLSEVNPSIAQARRLLKRVKR